MFCLVITFMAMPFIGLFSAAGVYAVSIWSSRGYRRPIVFSTVIGAVAGMAGFVMANVLAFFDGFQLIFLLTGAFCGFLLGAVTQNRCRLARTGIGGVDSTVARSGGH
jgi:hypothetical protein